MKVAIWASFPSPHQKDFYAALRRCGIDLAVRYLGEVHTSRRKLGWEDGSRLPSGESFLEPGHNPLAGLSDWRDRIHIVPGYGRRSYLQIAAALSDANVPWVHWSENSRPSWRSTFTWPLKHWYARLVNRGALGVFAQGDLAVADFQRWGIDPHKISHLYYAVQGFGIETERDEETSRFVGGRLVFVYIGSISRDKGSPVLLQSFAQVASEFRDVALVLVGPGPHVASCRRQARAAGIGHQVLFRDVVPISRVGTVLNCGHVFVQPSLYDGWSVALNEAASVGLPIIASDAVGAAYHLVEPQRNGLRVKAGCAHSLAAAMRTYASDPNLAAIHGRRSRILFQRFTPEANARRFVEAINCWLAASQKWPRHRAEWRQTSAA